MTGEATSVESAFAEIDSFRYGFIQLQDDRSNHLDLLIEEGQVSPPAKADPLVIGKQQFQRSPIQTVGRSFIFRWPDYVAYLVTNECYSRNGSNEVYTGKLVRRYTRSQLLDYLHASRTVVSGYPGPLIHLQLVSENHIVDVVSTEMPEVAPGNWPPPPSTKRIKRSFQM